MSTSGEGASQSRETVAERGEEVAVGRAIGEARKGDAGDAEGGERLLRFGVRFGFPEHDCRRSFAEERLEFCELVRAGRGVRLPGDSFKREIVAARELLKAGCEATNGSWQSAMVRAAKPHDPGRGVGEESIGIGLDHLGDHQAASQHGCG